MGSDTSNHANQQSASARNKKVSVWSAFALLCLFFGLIVRVVLLGNSGGQGGTGKNLGAAWKGDEGDGTGSIVPSTGKGSAQGTQAGHGGGKETRQAVSPTQKPSVESEKKDNEKKTDDASEESATNLINPAESNSFVLYQPVTNDGVQPQEIPLLPEGEGGAGAIRGTRGSSAAREGALRQFGGSRAGEEAVLKALRWLKAKQDTDGSWTEQNAPVAMTGVGLLCFLAHGETPQSKEFGNTVRWAINYLRDAVQENGTFDRQKGRNRCSYTHAMGAYGLAEAYGMTRDKSLQRVAEAAMDVIVKGQNKAGGWYYHYGETGNDTSIMGWQVQALKAAKLAGLKVDGLEGALRQASVVFKRHYQEIEKGKGGFGYQGRGISPNMTGVGTLCLQMIGEPNLLEVFGGLATIEDIDVICKGRLARERATLPRSQGSKAKGLPRSGRSLGGSTLYGWYYMTQAKFREGGEAWKRWNAKFGPEFIESQHDDGHWDEQYGPVFSTILACLSLEVYYRFLPTYIDGAEETGRAR